jgi:hypothetical protein
MKYEFPETVFLLFPSFFFTQLEKSIAKRNRTQPAQEDPETSSVDELRAGFTSVERVSKMFSGITRYPYLKPLKVSSSVIPCLKP